jgi:phenylalanyl-tRNA synthetase beta chain
MKFPISWLKEWVDVTVDTTALAEQLTMAGLEVDSIEPLAKDDAIIDIDLTPNRADCTSIQGIAREVSALLDSDYHPPAIEKVEPQITTTPEIVLNAPKQCPHYACRLIEGINMAETPSWMKARLQACGAQSTHPVVDILNYVLFATGQPLHAFDRQSLSLPLEIALTSTPQRVQLLDGQEKEVPADCLVIQDQKGIQAIAGIMGAQSSAVGPNTQDILLESAYFTPSSVAGKATFFTLHTESSYRYERGVHPDAQQDALEMATALILDICGGKPGPVHSVRPEGVTAPAPRVIKLRHQRIERLLGITVSPKTVEALLSRLGAELTTIGTGEWEVVAPLSRQDWNLEVDLIEEVARLVGYHNIPAVKPSISMAFLKHPETTLSDHRFKLLMADRGFQEVITYSFVDPAVQTLLFPEHAVVRLENPLSADKSVMRASCWPALLSTIAFHQRRQHNNLKIFESGQVFEQQAQGCQATHVVAGAICGLAADAQWATQNRQCDFYDMKSIVMALLTLDGKAADAQFIAAEHPSLHPGQSAKIMVGDQRLGWIGRLHPAKESPLGLAGPVYLFELDFDCLARTDLPKAITLSKYPSVRRDIALLVDDAVCAGAIIDTIKQNVDALMECWVFDVYKGKGVPEGQKSLAIGLILQELSRTLLEEEVDSSLQKAVHALEREFGAKLRE